MPFEIRRGQEFSHVVEELQSLPESRHSLSPSSRLSRFLFRYSPTPGNFSQGCCRTPLKTVSHALPSAAAKRNLSPDDFQPYAQIFKRCLAGYAVFANRMDCAQVAVNSMQGWQRRMCIIISDPSALVDPPCG